MKRLLITFIGALFLRRYDGRILHSLNESIEGKRVPA